jgi:hypothetical protein
VAKEVLDGAKLGAAIGQVETAGMAQLMRLGDFHGWHRVGVRGRSRCGVNEATGAKSSWHSSWLKNGERGRTAITEQRSKMWPGKAPDLISTLVGPGLGLALDVRGIERNTLEHIAS